MTSELTGQTFGQRLRAATDTHGPLCAGIDPHRALVESWGLGYDLDGLARFTDACVEAFAGHVGVVKPQSAFFEVFGSRGVAVLEGAISALRESGTLVILEPPCAVRERELTKFCIEVRTPRGSTLLTYQFWQVNSDQVIGLLFAKFDEAAIPLRSPVTFVKRRT